jgi:hypothetical protein
MVSIIRNSQVTQYSGVTTQAKLNLRCEERDDQNTIHSIIKTYQFIVISHPI